MFDIECAADIWEIGEINEVREAIGEFWAVNSFGIAVFVVVLAVPRDFMIGEEGLLDVVIHGIVQVLGGRSITTCGHGVSNVREEECEDECSEIDHCEIAEL